MMIVRIKSLGETSYIGFGFFAVTNSLDSHSQ